MKRFLSLLLIVAMAFCFGTPQSAIAAETLTVSDLPSWVTNTSFFGDIRLRYQTEHRQAGTTTSKIQHRERVRFRWGAKHKINDTLQAGWRIASGGTGTTSTNSTFTGFFANKAVGLDKAYIKWEPNEVVSVIGGKFRDADFWFAPSGSDLLWDTDLTFEGQMASFKIPGGEEFGLAINTAILVLNSTANSTSDSYMLAVQPVFGGEIADGVTLKTGVAYYGFGGLEGKAAPTTANTLNGGSLKYRPDALNPNAEIGFGWEDSNGEEFKATLIGDFVWNFDSDDIGFLFGASVGNKKLNKLGTWKASYNYRQLELDAWLDIFPDSDAYGGLTNVKGHEVKLDFGLTNNTKLTLDYYNTKRVGGKENQENLFQADVVVKF